MTTSLFVPGIPKGQPRARACIRGRHAGVYDPGTADAWKHAVADSWRLLPATKHTEPVKLDLQFFLPRPKSHFRSNGELKPAAPMFHTGKPDCDNLAKAVMDVLTRLGAWTDDSAVWCVKIFRRWASETNKPGCVIFIES